MTCGWGDILDVPIDSAVVAGPTRSILMQYRQITLDQVRNHATIYARCPDLGHPEQPHALHIFGCIHHAMIYHQDYLIGQNPIGVAFLKILI